LNWKGNAVVGLLKIYIALARFIWHQLSFTIGDSVPAFRVKLGTNDLNCVDVPLNPTHSLYSSWVLATGFLWLFFITVACVCQNVLLSDTSSDEDDDDAEMSLTDAEVKDMLRQHVRHKRYQRQFAADKEVKRLLTCRHLAENTVTRGLHLFTMFHQ